MHVCVYVGEKTEKHIPIKDIPSFYVVIIISSLVKSKNANSKKKKHGDGDSLFPLYKNFLLILHHFH